ncbi:MAG TPA: hypothetical protein PKD64_11925 [Pirellulaceae bacterium]|nr:hypothetical protein [Pirellulaceae bacterium]HMO92893.1 hypothetical protein [Pirellulaceae bacterium]HMP69171.1 hypothetical protein [Pirellulaceae bacterium]
MTRANDQKSTTRLLEVASKLASSSAIAFVLLMGFAVAGFAILGTVSNSTSLRQSEQHEEAQTQIQLSISQCQRTLARKEYRALRKPHGGVASLLKGATQRFENLLQPLGHRLRNGLLAPLLC